MSDVRRARKSARKKVAALENRLALIRRIHGTAEFNRAVAVAIDVLKERNAYTPGEMVCECLRSNMDERKHGRRRQIRCAKVVSAHVDEILRRYNRDSIFEKNTLKMSQRRHPHRQLATA